MTADSPLLDVPSNRETTIVWFTSPMSGIGRTGVIANLVWILASAGKKVLVLDWGTESPLLHDYLQPFHAESPPAGEMVGDELLRMLAPPPEPELSRRTSAPGETPPSPVARQYRLPMPDCRIDALAFRGSTGLGRRFPPQEDGEASVRLREQIRSAGYDYVLIDNPIDVSTAALKLTAVLSDLVAVCFHPGYSATLKAVKHARDICDRVPVGLRLLAVAVQFDDQDPHLAQQTRNRIQDAFADMLTASDGPDERELSADIVAIPYRPYDVLFDEALPVLLDEPGEEGSLLAAYERLASVITRGSVDRLRPVPPHIRIRYRYTLSLTSSDAQAPIFLVYASEDRRWADWVRNQLESGGARVARLSADDTWLEEPARPGVIVLASAHLSRSEEGERATDIMLRAQAESSFANRFDLVVVQVSDELVPEPLASAELISFVRCDEAQARTRLLYRFVLRDRPESERRSLKVSFPAGFGSTDSRSKLPPRNPEFVGRGAELEKMRDYFLTAEGICFWTLSGAAGIGKSEIAKEYAHRFTFDYDLQWWIPAGTRRSVHDSLIELAVEMKLPPGVRRPQTVLDALAGTDTSWLLIYDNVDDIDALAGLLPVGGTGHVIITTRTPATAASEINAFRSSDSIVLLRDQVPDLSVGDAGKVAALVEHMPLGLRLAAAWMRESAALMHRQVRTRAEAAEWAAAEFQARIDRELVQQPTSLAAALGVVTQTLRESDIGRLILRLARLCTFLSADGVAIRVLRSAPMLQALASAIDDGDALILDPLELDQVLQSGSRSGLFDVLWEYPPSLKIHRVVQDLVRGGMSPEERQICHQEVLQGLAAFAPTDPEANSKQDEFDFAELLKHLVPSSAATSSEVAVRRWIVDHVGHLHRKGDLESWRFAIELGERLLTRWEPSSRAETSLRMRLQFHLTNVQRELGRDPEAILFQDQALLEKQRAVLGPWHPRTLKTGRSKGADLRYTGQFAEACREEQSTLQGFREVLGDDHPDTLRAENNLALSFFLAGDVPSALELEQKNRAHRLALFGPDHPDVWWSACYVGIYLRELGKYADALKVLNDALARIVHIRPPGHPDELQIQWNRAIVMRCAGNATGALEDNTGTLQAYRALYGENHPRTQACKLSFALDHHWIGDSVTAVELAEECLQYHLGRGADHPFTALCRSNLAIFLRGQGDVERAFEFGNISQRDLSDQLGEEHPWALAAMINYAYGVAQVQDHESATELLQSTYDMCREFLVRDHPYTLRVAHNLSSDIDEWGDIGVDLP